MIKGSIFKEDMAILNVYVSTNRPQNIRSKN
jgi:hypothetical protein